jgi:transposase
MIWDIDKKDQEIQLLQEKNKILQEENIGLKKVIVKLQEENIDLRKVTVKLQEENIGLKKVTVKLQERIAQLEHRLNLDSHTSSKPPSSDGLSKKTRTQSLRKRGVRPTGGQKGHKGTTLKQVEIPDQVVLHTLENCPKCEKDLSGVGVKRIIKRQVIELPVIQPLIIEHQGEVKHCKVCDLQVSASFPTQVKGPVQYGEGIQALSIYLQHQHYLPQDGVVKEGLNFHESKRPLAKGKRGRRKRRIGHNLLVRLRDFKEDTLRFIYSREVPFTNNQAEREIRRRKVKQKISGCFRSKKGAEGFCRIRSFLSTISKQKMNALDSIKRVLHNEQCLSTILT